MINRNTSLSKNVVQFCRFLRSKGFTLGVEEETTALSCLNYIDYSSNHVFKLALKSVLCKSHTQLKQFEDLFYEFWKELDKAVESKLKTKPVIRTGEEAAFKSLKSWLKGNRSEEIEETALYSVNESISAKDFSRIPSDELKDVMQQVKALSKRLAAHSKRQYQKSASKNLPDLLRTLRKNMRHGGELLEIIFREPRRNKTKLVVLCDVSKSMDLYAGFFLQFMYSFQQVYSRMETFAFGTSLERITDVLRKTDFDSALKQLSAGSNTWSGGTRIGESLQEFVDEYALKLLDRKTTVIILSDGWDTGNIELLERSMKLIHAKCRKVIWLNPLAGYAAYTPTVEGMKAALPYIDVFAPVHNIDTLRQLSKWL